MNIQELIKKIEQWAIDRGLDKNGTVEGQFFKTAEEVAELIIAISKNNVKDIQDAVGDVFVTLVVGNVLCNKLEMEELVEIARTKSTMMPKRKIDYIYFLILSLHGLLFDETYEMVSILEVIECLMDICDWFELDFVDCVESAYKEIADRKGRVIDGTFIKEEDMI